MSDESNVGMSMKPLCDYHRKGELELPELRPDDACVACRIFYLEAQEGLLEQWQQRALKAEDDIKDMRRPLDAQMARLNETVTRLNGENERLRSALSDKENNPDAAERLRVAMLFIEEWANWWSYALGVDDDAPMPQAEEEAAGKMAASLGARARDMVIDNRRYLAALGTNRQERAG